jgi:ribosomal protein S18 acetylase RimI-like enzyme
MMKILFSTFDEDDLVVCSRLYVATFRDPPWNETWNEEDAFERLSDFLACPKSIAIKAECDGVLCGFLLGESQQWNGASFYYLKEICVANNAQRKGIGKNLMQKLEEILREKGISRIYLLTQREGIPSRFYSSLGFIESQTIIVMGKAVNQ